MRMVASEPGMLRAGLVGLPSSGRTTLFQLLTSAREAPRSHGKVEANVGVSRVPDPRLHQLSEMFQPRKRTAATVEFADMAAGRGAGASPLDVVAYRNVDALLRVVRAFGDPSVPHPQETIDPVRDARLIEDELILADLGAVERRLERLEKDLKKNPSADLKREQELLARGRAQLDSGRALRTLGLSADDTRRLRGCQFLSAKPLLLVLNLDEADLARAGEAATLAGVGFIELEHIPNQVRLMEADPQTVKPFLQVNVSSLREMERETILLMVQMYRGNVSRMAQVLQISRTTLWRKLKDYGIDPEEYR